MTSTQPESADEPDDPIGPGECAPPVCDARWPTGGEEAIRYEPHGGGDG